MRKVNELDTLADVLGQHRRSGRACSCGFWIYDLDPWALLDTHVANALLGSGVVHVAGDCAPDCARVEETP